MADFIQCPECGSADIAPRGDLCRVRLTQSLIDRLFGWLRGRRVSIEVHGLIGMCARCRAEVAWGRSGAYKVGRFKRPATESDAERIAREKETERLLSAVGGADRDIFGA